MFVFESRSSNVSSTEYSESPVMLEPSSYFHTEGGSEIWPSPGRVLSGSSYEEMPLTLVFGNVRRRLAVLVVIDVLVGHLDDQIERRALEEADAVEAQLLAALDVQQRRVGAVAAEVDQGFGKSFGNSGTVQPPSAIPLYPR